MTVAGLLDFQRKFLARQRQDTDQELDIDFGEGPVTTIREMLLNDKDNKHHTESNHTITNMNKRQKKYQLKVTTKALKVQALESEAILLRGHDIGQSLSLAAMARQRIVLLRQESALTAKLTPSMTTELSTDIVNAITDLTSVLVIDWQKVLKQRRRKALTYLAIAECLLDFPEMKWARHNQSFGYQEEVDSASESESKFKSKPMAMAKQQLIKVDLRKFARGKGYRAISDKAEENYAQLKSVACSIDLAASLMQQLHWLARSLVKEQYYSDVVGGITLDGSGRCCSSDSISESDSTRTANTGSVKLKAFKTIVSSLSKRMEFNMNSNTTTGIYQPDLLQKRSLSMRCAKGKESNQ